MQTTVPPLLSSQPLHSRCVRGRVCICASCVCRRQGSKPTASSKRAFSRVYVRACEHARFNFARVNVRVCDCASLHVYPRTRIPRKRQAMRCCVARPQAEVNVLRGNFTGTETFPLPPPVPDVIQPAPFQAPKPAKSATVEVRHWRF
jgi:hypothetical protein